MDNKNIYDNKLNNNYNDKFTKNYKEDFKENIAGAKIIEEYLSSCSMSEKILVLTLLSVLDEKDYKFKEDINTRIIVSLDRINNKIDKKEYKEIYKNYPEVIERIEKLHILCENYINNLDVSSRKKRDGLIKIITFLEALLKLNISFPDVAKEYLDDKGYGKK